VLRPPGPEQVKCQAPKPILLDTGEMKVPYDWAVSLSIFIMSNIQYRLEMKVPYD
jgi:hypothetical protein